MNRMKKQAPLWQLQVNTLIGQVCVIHSLMKVAPTPSFGAEGNMEVAASSCKGNCERVSLPTLILIYFSLTIILYVICAKN